MLQVNVTCCYMLRISKKDEKQEIKLNIFLEDT